MLQHLLREAYAEKAKLLNSIDPMAWLTALERIASGRTKAQELHMLLQWNWQMVEIAALVSAE